MKKTISVDLNGRNFIIEEDAHARLNGYLEDIKKHFGSGANVEEVMSDIEASIAEKLQSTITTYKNVVTLEDIENLIRVMGTSEDFDQAIGGERSETRETRGETRETKEEPQMKRKLYRDMDNAVLAGVASGLGAYFDIDPVIFRVLFIVFTLTGGFAILVYIALWIAMPEATTINQKLEMKGKAPTLSSLEEWTQSKEFKKVKSTFRKVLEVPFTVLRAIFGVIAKIWKCIVPVIRIFFGLLFIIGSACVLVGLGIATLYTILNLNAPYQFVHIPISELASSVPFIWILATGFFSLAIPTVFFLAGGVALLRKKAMMSFSLGSILVGLWMIAGITCCAVSLRYAPDLFTKMRSYPALQQEERTVDFSKNIESVSVSGRHIQLVLSSGTSTEAVLEGRQIDLDNVEVNEKDGEIMIIQKEKKEDEKICIGCDMQRVTVSMNADALKHINATDGANIYINGALKNEPSVEATDGANISWNNANEQSIRADISNQAQFRVSGDAKNMILTFDDANGYAQDVSAKSVILTVKGSSNAVLGKVEKLNVDSSDEGTVLYIGKPVITGNYPESNVVSYTVITKDEYDRIQERRYQDEENGLTGNPTSTAITNGNAFILIQQKSLSETILERIENTFQFMR